MKKWITLAFLCLAFFFYMSDRQLFGLLVPLICDDTGLNKVQIGFVDTAMYWVLALMMPISGLVGDRFPRTRVIALRHVSLDVRGAPLKDPVWVDLVTGAVYRVPERMAIGKDRKNQIFEDVPYYDAPVVLTERRLVMRGGE